MKRRLHACDARRGRPWRAARRPALTMAAAALFALVAMGLPARPAAAQEAAPAVTRGALLYSTHCIACHTEQMHWREQKLATDWPGLKRLVRHWQQVGKLDWSESDIGEVTRYLNDAFYRFETPTAAGEGAELARAEAGAAGAAGVAGAAGAAGAAGDPARVR